MPYALLQAYVRALPKLSAEDQVKQVWATATGGGNLSKDDAREYMRELSRQIEGDKPRRFVSPRDAAIAMGLRPKATG